jgi:hypothetical protein
VLPAALALLAYLSAGLRYALAASQSSAGDTNPRRSALGHYLDTHVVSDRIETVLRHGEAAVGMTIRQAFWE